MYNELNQNELGDFCVQHFLLFFSSDEDEISVTPSSQDLENLRSTSVLKYVKPLPNIGPGLQTAPPNLPAPRPQKTDSMKEPQVLVIADSATPCTLVGDLDDDDDPDVEMSPEAKYQPTPLPSEPDGAERRILLAIKMPSGERVQRYFRLTESLDIVLKFAEFMAHRHFDGHRFVCTTSTPRKVYSDMHLKLVDTGLGDRTVLFLQPP